MMEKRFKINKEILGGMKQNIKVVMYYVKEAEAAYDVDKVVEQFRNVAFERYSSDGMGGEKVVNLDDTIEIVKQGGVAVANNATTKNDDVCEWKSASDGEFIQNPHTKRLYSNEPSMQNVYCNTCGKKIKVVE